VARLLCTVLYERLATVGQAAIVFSSLDGTGDGPVVVKSVSLNGRLEDDRTVAAVAFKDLGEGCALSTREPARGCEHGLL
jgi:hypothetical protein